MGGVVLLRVRRDCALLPRAGYGGGGRGGTRVDESAASGASLCSPGSGCSWLMLISRLKRNSPLFGLVRLTARHVWLPLWPLRVALPVRRKVFSHSSRESPLVLSAPGSTTPAQATGARRNGDQVSILMF